MAQSTTAPQRRRQLREPRRRPEKVYEPKQTRGTDTQIETHRKGRERERKRSRDIEREKREMRQR